MLVWAGVVIGALLGAVQARRHKGGRLDMLQYAAGFGIAFGIVALFVNIVILRMGLGG